MISPLKKKAKIIVPSVSVEEVVDSEESSKIKTEEWETLNLHPLTLKAIEASGFEKPTDIQKAVIPLALEKDLDVLGAAETGSGKTLAFGIPIFEKWLKSIENKPKGIANRKLFALVVTPTRELALQVHKEICRLSTFVTKPGPFRSMALVGGLSQQKQERLLKAKPHLIIATPGRLWSLMDSDEEHLSDLSHLQVLAIDEIDRMVERGHFKELDLIVQRIHANLEGDFVDDIEMKKKSPKNNLQTLIFSATLTFTHSSTFRPDGSQISGQTTAFKVKKLVASMKMRKKHKIVDLTNTNRTPTSLMEYRINCANLHHKDSCLYYLLCRYPSRILVFTNSIDATRRLYNILNKLKLTFPVLLLHAKMMEQKRLKNLEKFTELENSVLIATDVAARGLDIQGVDIVIHYQVPKTTENYVHRSGRTARASKVGRSILLIDPTDMQFYKRICKNLRRINDLEVLEIDSPKMMAACQHRIKMAVELEASEFGLKKTSSRNEWFRKAAEEADIILDDDIIQKDEENGGKDTLSVLALRRLRKNSEKALNAALRQPLPGTKKT